MSLGAEVHDEALGLWVVEEVGEGLATPEHVAVLEALEMELSLLSENWFWGGG